MKRKAKKICLISLLIIICFILLMIAFNMGTFFLHKNELTKEERNITISRHSELFGESKWEFQFYLPEKTDARLGISAGLLGKKTEIKLLKDQNEAVFEGKFGNQFAVFDALSLEKGYYTLHINHHRNPFNHLLFTFKAENLIFSEPLSENFMVIKEAPEKGFNWKYILYVPEPLLINEQGKKTTAHLMVETNNTGKPSNDMEIHLLKAKSDMSFKESVADRLNVVYLMPVFPRFYDDYDYSHSFDRKTLYTKKQDIKRLDLQLIAMINDARTRLSEKGIRLMDKIVIGGFSSSGSFASRFTVIHPELVKTAVIGAPGGWPIVPLETYKGESLRFPIGIDDLEKFIGKPINISALKEIPLFFFMGAEDTNDSVIYRDSFDLEDEKLIFSLFGKLPVERFKIAEEIYTSNGYDAQFKIYPGVGHEVIGEMIEDMVNFIQDAIEE